MAAMLVLEPIFEADMPSEQYAYRQNRNAHSAVREVHGLLVGGHRDVVDADLSGYFDTIPHVELMKSVARRVVDRRVLHLLKMWLDAPVEEEDERRRKKRTTVNRDAKQRYPARLSHFTAAVQSVHAAVCVGVEAMRAWNGVSAPRSSTMLTIWSSAARATAHKRRSMPCDG